MSNTDKVFKVNDEWSKIAHANKEIYETKYKKSLEDNDAFWAEEGKRIDWIKPYSKIKDVIYSKAKTEIKWFYDGTLNASYNCIDRHLKKKPIKLPLFLKGMILPSLKKSPIKN